jgi:hypothetical protein
MVTSEQVTQVGGQVRSNRVDVLAAGKLCTWVFANGAGTAAAGVDTLDKDGLSHLYALKAQNSGVTTFKPQNPVLGYPAVVFANGGETPGTCQLAVGLSNETTYTVISRLSTGSPMLTDPCALSTKIAEFAIEHLKGA